MRRALLASLVAAATLTACVGSTEPATNVSTLSAQLNAKGFTNDGPATWWWEYDTVKSDLGTANDTEVCGYPPEPDRRCGPASAGTASSQIPLSVTVTGLTPNTTYYFRACGQDTNDVQPTCGNTLSFKTLAGTAYTEVTACGPYGEGNGQLAFPLGVVADRAGNVYVVEQSNNRVQKFSSSCRYLTKWGSAGLENGQFSSPVAIAIDQSGDIYVRDRTSRIQKFTSSGAYLDQWGSFGTGNGQFAGIGGVAFDTAGNVYAGDEFTHRIQKFNAAGDYLSSWGGQSGAGADQISGSMLWLAIDQSDRVYLAEDEDNPTWYPSPKTNNRVHRFNSTGGSPVAWGWGVRTGAAQLETCDATTGCRAGLSGAGDGQFSAPIGPSGVAVDTANNVYVADLGNNRIQKFTANGSFITKWGGVTEAFAVAPDRFGNVWVLGTCCNQLHKFKPTQ
jgi:hypothetical protein